MQKIFAFHQIKILHFLDCHNCEFSMISIEDSMDTFRRCIALIVTRDVFKDEERRYF